MKTPQILDRSLWERSGHWEKFHSDMFVCETDEGETLAVKPMNCPGHIQIFNHGQRSYRELPLRMAEFEGLHRYEGSGGLHGLLRVRGLAQDDGHIFCREDQVESETRDFLALLNRVYADLGVELHSVKLALRPELRAGTDEMWDMTEAMLERAARAVGLEFEILPGEGGFYAPKLEFHLKDAIGRTWQCGTLQLDMVMPERLDATYIGEDGAKHRPVMLHRAIFGSIERFLGVLIEHYAGAFPLWLAPVQAVVATITSEADDYAAKAAAAFRKAGLQGRDRPAQREGRLQGARALPGQGPGDRRGRPPRSRGGQGRAAPARLAGADRGDAGGGGARCWPRKRRRRICVDTLPPPRGEGQTAQRSGWGCLEPHGAVRRSVARRQTAPPVRRCAASTLPARGRGVTRSLPAAPPPPPLRRCAPPARLPS